MEDVVIHLCLDLGVGFKGFPLLRAQSGAYASVPEPRQCTVFLFIIHRYYVRMTLKFVQVSRRDTRVLYELFDSK